MNHITLIIVSIGLAVISYSLGYNIGKLNGAKYVLQLMKESIDAGELKVMRKVRR